MQIQTDDEQDSLIEQIAATAEVIGTTLTSIAAAMIAEDLAKYPFLDCCFALKKCRAECRTRLTLADIVSRINEDDGRPAPNEAWSIALQSSDEMDTVVWTEETATAYEAARAVMEAGDKVGARMAFISAYERLVDAARAAGSPVKWNPSFGWDKDLRQRALDSAVKLHRIPTDMAKAHGYLSAPITDDGRALVAALTGPSSRGLIALTADAKTRDALLAEENVKTRDASPEIRERIRQMNIELKAKRDEREKLKRQLVDAQRRDLEQRKSATQKRIDEAHKSGGSKA